MIQRGCKLIGVVTAAAIGIVCVARTQAQATQSGPAPKPAAGWTLPAEADTLKNPLTVNDQVLATGMAVFKDKCARCHGPGALGDGPDADPDAEEMDLTNARRTERNPDGVVFHKILTGRGRPKMPAFKDELSQEQIWTVVAYVQTLRKK